MNETKFTFGDLPMKYKALSGSSIILLILFLSLLVFTLNGCGEKIYNHQLDALDTFIDASESEFNYLAPYDPDYREFSEEEKAKSIGKRSRMFGDARDLVKTIRSGKSEEEGSK